ncbi:MAG: phosphoribosylamine--glycine ligase [Spirochaetales bacterium]|nr:phosphoribosylamine--glycine ligase [Spirochaetales bacterium]
MKILVLGSGAREHALAWKFAQSNRISGLFIAPGNAGTEEHGVNLPHLNPNDVEAVTKACKDRSINLVFVGPEDPLANGIVDALSKSSINAIGPGKDAAMLESSKVFSKAFMKSHAIPTAGAKEFDNAAAFEKHINRRKGRFVIKKSGLAAGKGVLESEDKSELLEFGKRVLETDTLLVEDYLEGWEVSVFALSDGVGYKLLPFCADFKKAMDNDLGLNTGGMGAICPVPLVSQSLEKLIIQKIVEPTFSGLKKDGLTYRGVVYFGIMVTESGPKLLEYNVRFGDPETQVLMPLIQSDLVSLCEAMLSGTIDKFPLQISTDSALGVVVASGGYPDEYKKGVIVESLPNPKVKNQLVFHAATKRDDQGRIVTGGGRCFTVVGTGPNTLSANCAAYKAVPDVVFEGAWWRHDIGKKYFMNE